MAKAVLIQSRHADYSDVPGERYQFPTRSYLGVAVRTVGDWVVFYEGRRGGGRGYYAVQRVADVVPDLSTEGCHLLVFEPASLLSFERNVPYTDEGGAPYESRLAGPDGRPVTGGLNTSAVRILPDPDFARIVEVGLTPLSGPEALPRVDEPLPPAPLPGLQDQPVTFSLDASLSDRTRVLTNRLLREQSFARQVKVAYRGRCAMSGLALRNGGGRPEVNAAHIRPVASQGPDVVQNGLALSGTLHWMFDRGLVSVGQDHSILVAKGTIADEVQDRLFTPDRRLVLPTDRLQHPHGAFLDWHRRNVFKG